MQKISIVIPVHNHWQLTHSLLFDLYNFNRQVSEVIVVDDASKDVDHFQGLEWWQDSKMLPLRVVETDENVGFLRASNLGMSKAKGDILILISNDVQVKQDIITPISEELKHDEILVGARLISDDAGWNAFEVGRTTKVFKYIEGFLLACRAGDWDKLGGFDERFEWSDYEDMSLSTKALSMGYGLVALDLPLVVHLGAQSMPYSKEREAITIRNREVFRKIWIK